MWRKRTIPFYREGVKFFSSGDVVPLAAGSSLRIVRGGGLADLSVSPPKLDSLSAVVSFVLYPLNPECPGQPLHPVSAQGMTLWMWLQ